MPIRFRCGYCNRLLGIARRKAGTETTCPHCGYTLTVPSPPAEDRTELAEFEPLLKPAAPESGSDEVDSAGPSPAAAAAPKPPPLPPGEKPLFERDLESVFGALMTATKPAEEQKRKPAPTSGMEALSLAPERGQVVLSPQAVTILAIAAVVLLVVSFAVGYLVGSVR